ncbi:MAG: hypothetical protein HYY40_09405 [Bacteroidetes bacterium]|nr:hypothetical protein [Bacteroidota bacterium]
MKTVKIFLVAAFICALSSGFLFAQGYEMKPGEVITVSPEGQLLNTNIPATSKYYDENSGTAGRTEKKGLRELYNKDGRPKIPGYTPTGIEDVDAENYKKAKVLFAQNDPEGYKKWTEKYSQLPHPGHLTDIAYEEFLKMPEAKKQHILCNPGKYRVVKKSGEIAK